MEFKQPQICLKKFRLDCKIDFQNIFYTKCINIIIDSTGPSIILTSIFKPRLVAQPKINLALRATFYQKVGSERVNTGKAIKSAK